MTALIGDATDFGSVFGLAAGGLSPSHHVGYNSAVVTGIARSTLLCCMRISFVAAAATHHGRVRIGAAWVALPVPLKHVRPAYRAARRAARAVGMFRLPSGRNITPWRHQRAHNGVRRAGPHLPGPQAGGPCGGGTA